MITLDGLSLDSAPVAPRLATLSVGVIASVEQDILICELPDRPQGQSEEDATFPVAMPFDLQRTRLDGKTIVRHDEVRIKYEYTSNQERKATLVDSAGDEGAFETQVIVPAYNPKSGFKEAGGKTYTYEGDYIVFARVTWPTGADNIFYIDMTPGRAWAKKKGDE
jgi:hypothetical protein